MLSGSASCGAPTTSATTLVALAEATIKAKDLGFYKILFLCCSNIIVHACNLTCTPNWQEKTMITDILNLQQQGVFCKPLFVNNLLEI